jgi:phosphoglycerate dehydrogenase-like enzyme
MRIGLFGSFDPSLRDGLRGHELVAAEEPAAIALRAVLPALDGIVLRSPFKLVADDAVHARRLAWIVRAGSGADAVSPAFTERGVEVVTVPVNARSVAELALAMIITLVRGVGRGQAALRAGRWEKNASVGRELGACRIGIAGYGRIGRELAAMAAAFGAATIAFDRSPNDVEKASSARRWGTRFVALDELLQTADIVVCCLPDNATTRGLLDARRLRLLKRHAVLVNVGRGSLLSLDDVHALLVEGAIAGAGIDVYASEPPPAHPIFARDDVVCTPHIGAQTHESRRRIASAVLTHVDRFSARLAV